MRVKVKAPSPIAPLKKDGSDVRVVVEIELDVYWDDELKVWVLTRPLMIESIQELT